MITDQYEANLLFFSDLNFNLSEPRVLALCDQFETEKVDARWFAMCGFNGTSANAFRRMAAAGCTKIGWGIEALTESSLSRLKARQSLEKIRGTLEAASAAGIINRAYLMMGYPWQSRQDLQRSIELLEAIPVDEIKVSFYTPFPGTPAYDEYRSRLRTTDFSQYDTDHPVLDALDMEAEELVEARRLLFSRFYESHAYQLRSREKTRRFPHLKKSYEELFLFLHQRGIIK